MIIIISNGKDGVPTPSLSPGYFWPNVHPSYGQEDAEWRSQETGVEFQGPLWKAPVISPLLFGFSFTLLCVMILEFHDAPSLDFNLPVKSTSLWQWTKPRVMAYSQHKHHVLCPGALLVKLPLDTGHLHGLCEIVSNSCGDLCLFLFYEFVKKTRIQIWLTMGQFIMKLIQTRLRQLPLSSKGNRLDITCITR